MGVDLFSQIMTNAVMKLLTLSLPCIGMGLIIGFSVSLFQALTQIQEQTLTFVPKMIAVMLMVGLTAGWIASSMIAFCIELWMMIPNLS